VSAHQAIVFELPLALHYLLGQARSASMDRPMGAHFPTSLNAGRLTVAYVSASIGRHAVSEQFSGAFERHDRKRFDAQCVAINPEVTLHAQHLHT
jgi:predicted O-linked N-acetylglucosamine transferase (SPINDLY family)